MAQNPAKDKKPVFFIIQKFKVIASEVFNEVKDV